MIVVNMVSQNSSSPSIETSKTSIAFTIENTLNAHADCGYFTVATDELRNLQRASTRTRYKT
jgi:hypothetical protein